MTIDELRALKPGDIIRHVHGSYGLVVTGNYGSRVTAVRTVDVTNPDEWTLVQPAAPAPLAGVTLSGRTGDKRSRWCCVACSGTDAGKVVFVDTRPAPGRSIVFTVTVVLVLAAVLGGVAYAAGLI